MIKKLYIFHPTLDVSTVLQSSTLLTSSTQILDRSQYHTSLGDLSASDIISIAHQFDELELVDVGFDRNDVLWHETKILLNYLSHTHKVTNFAVEQPKTFTSNVYKQIDSKKIWIFGCSHAHGIGLDHPDQRFGAIAARHLNLPAVFVTRPGSSLQWSLRHLLNCEFGQDDIVIWQLTSPPRVTVYDTEPKEVVLATSSNRCLLDVFNDQQIFFHHCSLINYGVRYLRSKNIKFVLTSLLEKQSLFYEYLDEYTKYPEYCYIPVPCVDRGNDGQHFGPLSHQGIAKHIIDRVQYKDE